MLKLVLQFTTYFCFFFSMSTHLPIQDVPLEVPTHILVLHRETKEEQKHAVRLC